MKKKTQSYEGKAPLSKKILSININRSNEVPKEGARNKLLNLLPKSATPAAKSDPMPKRLSGSHKREMRKHMSGSKSK